MNDTESWERIGLSDVWCCRVVFLALLSKLKRSGGHLSFRKYCEIVGWSSAYISLFMLLDSTAIGSIFCLVSKRGVIELS